MQDPQQVFLALEEKKKRLKDLKKQFADECKAVPGWDEATEEKSMINARIKQLRMVAKDNNTDLAVQMDDLKIDIDSDKELLNDILMTKMMKGESIEIVDKYENAYEPQLAFSFKKEI